MVANASSLGSNTNTGGSRTASGSSSEFHDGRGLTREDWDWWDGWHRIGIWQEPNERENMHQEGHGKGNGGWKGK